MNKQQLLQHSTIQKHIGNLKNRGVIRREGADKGGKWVIVKTNG
jgi:predicted HTH transcriptional regulator